MSDPHALLSRYITPGGLCLDIGANLGKHAWWMLDLGATVIAVEPDPQVAARIPQHENLTVLECAVSGRVGQTQFFVSPGHEYVSTVEPGYLQSVQTHATYGYNPPVMVETTTLDRLIELYGLPVFCKVDVEGHERAVFDGLSTPLPALSFEVHDFDLNKADHVLARLAELGEYEVMWSPREEFELQAWDPSLVSVFGDIYAVLR